MSTPVRPFASMVDGDDSTAARPFSSGGHGDSPAVDDGATVAWPYQGGAGPTAGAAPNPAADAAEATTRFAAPLEDADATANFGFGNEPLSPAEAAERRAAFARGEAERRATAAQSHLDRISAERAAAAPDAGAEDPDAQPHRDDPPASPWSQPPRERG
jgi:hypothetical protein